MLAEISEVGTYKRRKQERKHALDQENDQEKKKVFPKLLGQKKRKHAFDQEKK